jgi:hypothetical protein
MVRLCQWATSGSDELPHEEICPFFLNASYHTAIALLDMSNKNRNEQYINELRHIKSLMTLCGQRWKLGGELPLIFITISTGYS